MTDDEQGSTLKAHEPQPTLQTHAQVRFLFCTMFLSFQLFVMYLGFKPLTYKTKHIIRKSWNWANVTAVRSKQAALGLLTLGQLVCKSKRTPGPYNVIHFWGLPPSTLLRLPLFLPSIMRNWRLTGSGWTTAWMLAEASLTPTCHINETQCSCILNQGQAFTSRRWKAW